MDQVPGILEAPARGFEDAGHDGDPPDATVTPVLPAEDALHDRIR